MTDFQRTARRRKKALPLLAALVGFVLVGCTTGSPSEQSTPKAGFSTETPFKVEKLPFLVSFGLSGENALSRLRGKTVMTFDVFHGAQYEYLGPNGTSYLWYGKNDRSLSGRYFIRGEGLRTDICWIYGTGTYNPVTRQSGDKPDCSPLNQYLTSVKEMANGDVLKLSSGKVPFQGIGSHVSFGLVWNRLRGDPRFAK